MANKNQSYGKQAETIAAAYLKKAGYRILERNWRNGIGEIDIVAVEGKTTVFVEVKARKNGRFGSPKWAVTAQKQRKVSMVALSYLKANGADGKARFDVVSVTGSLASPSIEVVKNAFELAYR